MGNGQYLHLERKEEGIPGNARRDAWVETAALQSWGLQSRDVAIYWEHIRMQPGTQCPDLRLISDILMANPSQKPKNESLMQSLTVQPPQAQSGIELSGCWTWRGRWKLSSTDVVKAIPVLDWDISIIPFDIMELVSTKNHRVSKIVEVTQFKHPENADFLFIQNLI